MNAPDKVVYMDSVGKTKRDDGAMMDKMVFDNVFSNKHTHKDTESGIGLDLVPVCDPRRDKITRPKSVPYGRMHQVQTAYGVRQLLPTRTIMGIGDGPGRSVDF